MLRDLHAGPMRFGEFLAGLPGVASNLLATRLQKLQSDGLVAQNGQLYSLTDLGRRTEGVLWELALLGGQFPPDDNLKQPGHLRLVAVTLQNAMRRVVPDNIELVAEMVLDTESFTIEVNAGGNVAVRYGAPDTPAAVVTTSYEPMMAAAAGALPLEAFAAEHVHVEGPPEIAGAVGELMMRVLREGFADTTP